MSRHFARPLSARLRPEDWKRIFFGINELSTIHAGFYSSLWKARNGEDLAQVFLKWREQFLIYGDYCANLTVARNTLQEVCSRDEEINREVIVSISCVSFHDVSTSSSHDTISPFRDAKTKLTTADSNCETYCQCRCRGYSSTIYCWKNWSRKHPSNGRRTGGS